MTASAITSRPVGPGCVIDDSRSSAESLKITPHQTHPMKDRDLRLCMGDYVGPPTNTAKFGRNRTSGGAPTRGEIARWCDFFFSFFLSFFFLFLGNAPSPNAAADLHARWLKRRGLAQGRAFWGLEL